MRSIKVEPAAAVMRTRIQSDRTCVPPVTAERSPPDSRMTGADSPVIAASLTEAMPSTTSPSEGMVSPASTSTTSFTLRVSPGTISKRLRGPPGLVAAPSRRLACVSVRARRRLSACALPRPSATASARLAKTTVNHSHTMIWPLNRRLGRPSTRSRRKRTVVSAATTSTTNMTGFLAIARGSSFLNDAPMAGTRMLGSRMEDLDMAGL